MAPHFPEDDVQAHYKVLQVQHLFSLIIIILFIGNTFTEHLPCAWD